MIDSKEYAKKNRDKFYHQVINGKNVSKNKIAIFMAGSPGAGKTEVATELISFYQNICLIDADNFREGFPEYNGKNSHEFQSGASWLVGDVFRRVTNQGYSFLLDGTFALESASKNIKQVLKHSYEVNIYFIYQNPFIAWDFVKLREDKEGRNVPKETFINAYFMSRNNVIKVKKKFGELININILFKDFKGEISEIHEDTDNPQLILPELYTTEFLKENLK
jgi:predicted ABC-type ATPase